MPIDFSKIKHARYIKLGKNGCWEDQCLNDGTIRLGYYEVPHEMGLQGDKKAIRALFMGLGKKQGVASDYARQVIDFYAAAEDTLWVTFANGCLWWAIADTTVEFNGMDKNGYPDGSRLRRVIGTGWRNTSIDGAPLLISKLSGRLISLARYQQTICEIKEGDFEYLLLKVQGHELPLVSGIKAAKKQMLIDIANLIRLLTWADFELFVGLIFERGGRRRISSLGGQLKTIDMELEDITTGDLSIVQIKAKTNQRELDEYVARLCKMTARHIFYVYHTAENKLQITIPNMHLIGLEELANKAFQVGLVDWLLDKAG